MSANLTLLVIGVALIAGLIVATFIFRGHQRRLLRQRRALHQHRGAVHIRELALATQIYTGRNDIALTLLPLAMKMLDEARSLNPTDHSISAALRECRNLSTALRDGTTPSGPELLSALDSESALNRARMELMEAARLLGRAERLDGMKPQDVQEMLDALKQTQRQVELRLNLRQAAQVATLQLHSDQSANQTLPPAGLTPEGPPRLTPIAPTH